MSKNLYQKYRPYTLEEVQGQDYIKKILKSSIKNSSVQNAYLFNGPRGTGKTTIARIFARLVNCEDFENPGEDNCEICNYFKENTEFEDIFELDAASNNGVDDIRKIIDNVKYQPIKLKKKVYIIDEVHMLSKGAFNALLKTLEEPQGMAIFILATTEVNKIPPTILSRCQRLDFERIKPLVFKEHLKEILDKENVTYDENVFEPIIKISDGCMRDGLGLLQKVIIAAEDKITLEVVESSLGLVGNKKYELLYENILNKKDEKVLKIWQDIYFSGANINSFIIEFQVFLKEKYLQNRNTRLLRMIKIVNDVEQRAVYTQNLNNLVELLLLQLASLEEQVQQVKEVRTFSEKKVTETSSNKMEISSPKKVGEISNVPKESFSNVVSPVREVKTELAILDSTFKEEVFRKLDVASKEKRKEMVSEFLKVGQKMHDNKKFGLSKFFLEANIRAASDEEVIVSIEKEFKDSYVKRQDKLQENLKNIKINIVSTEEWEIIKIEYMQRFKKEKPKELEISPEDQQMLENVEKKLKKKIKIIKE